MWVDIVLKSTVNKMAEKAIVKYGLKIHEQLSALVYKYTDTSVTYLRRHVIKNK